MNISPIKDNVAKLPKHVLSGVNRVGRATINSKDSVVKFVSEHTKNSKETKEMPKFIADTKDKIKNIKLPEFANRIGEFVKNHKETVVGATVLALATACAVAIACSVAGKISEAKADKNNSAEKLYSPRHAHQG